VEGGRVMGVVKKDLEKFEGKITPLDIYLFKLERCVAEFSRIKELCERNIKTLLLDIALIREDLK
jgi:hypothetical protein